VTVGEQVKHLWI